MVHPLFSACRWLNSLGLLPERDLAFVSGLVSHECPFAQEFRSAAEPHLHVRIADVATLPAEVRQSTTLDRPGFVVATAPGGVHISFSSIPVIAHGSAQPERARPHLDHVGLDFEDESELMIMRARATAAGWPSMQQGGKGRPVSCCYASVAAKLWVFPPGDVAIEFAFGEGCETGTMGDDLRPEKPISQGRR